MHQSKLIGLVRRFSKKEIKRAQQFLKSPYFNTNDKLTRLFDLIAKYHPDLTSPKLEKTKVYRYLQLGNTFEDNKLRAYMARLRQLLERFIVHETLEQNTSIYNRLKIDFYAQNSTYHQFDSLVEESIKSLQKDEKLDTETYLELFFLFQKRYYHRSNTKFSERSTDIRSAMEYLDLFFTTYKLNYGTELYNQKEIFQHQLDLNYLEQALTFAQKLPKESYPVVNLYANILELVKTGPNMDKLEECIELFRIGKINIGEFEKVKILNNLISLSITFLNSGNLAYQKHAFAFYQLAITEGLITPRENIGFSTFINIVVLSAATGNLDWSVQFLEDYSSSLDEKIRANTSQLARGYWHYYTAEHSADVTHYDKAIELIRELSFRKPQFNLRGRILYLRIYFEYEFLIKGHENILLSWIRNFRVWLTNDTTFNPENIQKYLNLLKYITKIVQQISRHTPLAEWRPAMLLQIKTDKKIVLKGWLIKKLEAL